MFAQQVLKDQNCNFSSFENSGEDLINEVSIILVSISQIVMRHFHDLFYNVTIKHTVFLFYFFY